MSFKAAIAVVLTVAASGPALAHRLTLEVWPDTQPDHASYCTVALTGGWITVVKVRGLGMPSPYPLRWRASPREEAAMTEALQAFLAQDLVSVDPHAARQPPAPFVTVTWMTRLDDRMASGLYIQSGLPLPLPLADATSALGLTRACGLSAKAVE